MRGDDANARQFPSLHSVQRHMADTGRFKMAWEDNEDEYEDFYNFDAVPIEEADTAGMPMSAILRLRRCLSRASASLYYAVCRNNDNLELTQA